MFKPENESKSELLSARFLERIEDELEAHDGLPFEELPYPSERSALVAQFKAAIPVLVSTYAEHVGKTAVAEFKDNSGAPTQENLLDYEFCRELLEVNKEVADMPFRDFPREPVDNIAELRKTLPVLIHIYRMRKGLPLRMR